MPGFFLSMFFRIHKAEYDWIGTQLGCSFADQSVWVTNLRYAANTFYRVNSEQPEDNNVAVSINVVNGKIHSNIVFFLCEFYYLFPFENFRIFLNFWKTCW